MGGPAGGRRAAGASFPLLADAAVAVDPAARPALWAYRERHTESISAAGIPHKLDIAVPLARLAAFRGALDGVIAEADGPSGATPGRPRRRRSSSVTSGSGNLHVNVLGPAPADQAVDEAVLGLAAAHGGTISAEHGIGRAKVSVAAAEPDAGGAIGHAGDQDGARPVRPVQPGRAVLLTGGGRPRSGGTMRGW